MRELLNYILPWFPLVCIHFEKLDVFGWNTFKWTQLSCEWTNQVFNQYMNDFFESISFIDVEIFEAGRLRFVMPFQTQLQAQWNTWLGWTLTCSLSHQKKRNLRMMWSVRTTYALSSMDPKNTSKTCSVIADITRSAFEMMDACWSWIHQRISRQSSVVQS